MSVYRVLIKKYSVHLFLVRIGSFYVSELTLTVVMFGRTQVVNVFDEVYLTHFIPSIYVLGIFAPG